MAFQKAVKTSAKLRLAIAGPSGSGKTYTSLAIATALGGPIAYVDTEHGSASKYADVFTFDVMEMEPPFHPRRFAEAIKEAAAGGYKVVVIDSVTHAWNGTGGMLDIVEEIAKRSKNPNSFAAWKEATPIQNALIDAIVSAPIHVIATMRSKQEYVQDRDERTGKTAIRKVGMAPQQRDGFEYEFDVFLDMDIDNNAIVSKTRCPELTGRVFNKPGKDIAAILTNWLTGAPAPERKATPAPEQKANGKQATSERDALLRSVDAVESKHHGSNGDMVGSWNEEPAPKTTGNGKPDAAMFKRYNEAKEAARKSGKFNISKHLDNAWMKLFKEMNASDTANGDAFLAAWAEYVANHEASDDDGVPEMAF